MVAITSSGKSVTFRWICSRLSTRARTTPNEKSTRLRCTRSWCQLPGRAPHPAVPARWLRGAAGSGAPEPCGQRAAAIMPRERLYGLAAPELEQPQTWSCSLGIGCQAHRGRSTPRHHTKVTSWLLLYFGLLLADSAPLPSLSLQLSHSASSITYSDHLSLPLCFPVSLSLGFLGKQHLGHLSPSEGPTRPSAQHAGFTQRLRSL